MIHILIASLGFLFFLGIAEIAKQLFQFPADLTRKIAHMLSGVYAFFLPYYLTRDELILLSILFVFILFITKTFRMFESIHGVSRKTHGEIYFPLSLGFLAYFFLPEHLLAAQFGLLVLGFSDAIASIVGIEYGSHTVFIWGHKKSIEGSAAFLITTIFLIVIFLPSSSFLLYSIGLLGAIALTFVELFSIRGLDNFFLPILGASFFQYILLALR
ncbi:MAG: hypothetical protein PHV42_01585 [Candidatus Pacebacteria bacterium]|nr:hypothetical protein [Candidatus Paceibacterota bacterium]